MRNAILGTFAAFIFALGSTSMSQHAKFNPASWNQTVRDLVSGQPDFIDITTPATSLQELQIPHGLGRKPKGYLVIAGDPAPGTSTSSQTFNDRVAIQMFIVKLVSDINPGYMDFQSATIVGSATEGYVAPRAGSITAISGVAYCSAVGNSDTTVTYQVRKNGTSLCTVTSTAFTGTGDKSLYTTFTPGTYTFAAGDVLSVYQDQTYTSTKATFDTMQAVFEAAFDQSSTVVGSVTAPVQAGSTAWDTNYLYLKFVATSTPLTIAVW